MCSPFYLSDQRPFVETCSKGAVQPLFEPFVKIWILWSLVHPSTCLQGFVITLGELKWYLTKEGSCPTPEDISSALLDETERASGEGIPLGPSSMLR